MFGAEGKPGTIERVIRRSEDSNADPRTDEVADLRKVYQVSRRRLLKVVRSMMMSQSRFDTHFVDISLRSFRNCTVNLTFTFGPK